MLPGKVRGMGVAGIILAGLGLNGFALAAEQDVHQHGHGELNVVVDGHDLALELRLPAANVVGFEHKPVDDQQTSQVQQVLAGFSSGADWFEPSVAAACQLESAQASLVGLESAESGAADDDHDHKHAEHDHEDGHSDFEGVLQYHCDNASALASVKVLFFPFVDGVTELKVQLVTPDSQTRTRLSPQNPVLQLGR